MLSFGYLVGFAEAARASVLLSEAYVKRINNDPNSTWTAAIPSDWKNFTDDQLRGLASATRDIPKDFPRFAPGRENATLTSAQLQTLPNDFDSNVMWPICVGPNHNQGDCGSCWAFATAQFMSFRQCIYNWEAYNTLFLSPQEILSCAAGNRNGCGGGSPYVAVKFMAEHGLHTDECIPYVDGNTPESKSSTTASCPNGYCTARATDTNAYFALNYWIVTNPSGSWLENMYRIGQELTQGGPIAVIMQVWSDFFAYSGSVYVKRADATFVGNHVVMLTGWGNDNGMLYWLIKNSWTPSWGINGYAKILRREGWDMGITTDAVSANPLSS